MDIGKEWDAFLSHATEDKEAFVAQLAKELERRGFKIWYDDFCLKVGDSLRESIERGLVSSRYAIVILSHSFFGKEWPQKELSALVAQESVQSRKILPVWFGITRSDVLRYAPTLADRFAAIADHGVEVVTNKLERVLKIEIPETSEHFGSIKLSSNSSQILDKQITWRSISDFTLLRFGKWGIDEFWQRELLADLDCLKFKTISDIDQALIRASIPVALYACENPSTFKTGTDFITKALGFVDETFRKRHNFSLTTLNAFGEYEDLIRN